MAVCQIFRDSQDNVVSVEAPNGNKSKLYQDALKYLRPNKDYSSAVRNQAMEIWSAGYTTMFKNYTTGEVDVNGEPKIKEVLQFIEYLKQQSAFLSPQELAGIQNTMYSLGEGQVDVLYQKIQDTFYKKGYFELNERDLKNGGLYSELEVRNILNDPALQQQVQRSVGNFKADYFRNYNELQSQLTVEPFSELFKQVDTSRTSPLGTFEMVNPHEVEQGLAAQLVGIDNKADFTDAIEGIDNEAIQQKYYNDSQFANDLFNHFSSMTEIERMVEDGNSLSPKQSNDVKSDLEQTVKTEANASIQPKINVLNQIAPSVWEQSIANIQGVLTSVEKSLAQYNIDVIGLSQSAQQKSPREVMVFLDALNKFTRKLDIGTATDSDLNSIAGTINSYFGRPKTAEFTYAHVHPDNSDQTLVQLETQKSETELFSRQGLIKTRSGYYQKVNVIENMDTLYQTAHALLEEQLQPVVEQTGITNFTDLTGKPLELKQIAENYEKVTGTKTNVVTEQQLHEEIANRNDVVYSKSGVSLYEGKEITRELLEQDSNINVQYGELYELAQQYGLTLMRTTDKKYHVYTDLLTGTIYVNTDITEGIETNAVKEILEKNDYTPTTGIRIKATSRATYGDKSNLYRLSFLSINSLEDFNHTYSQLEEFKRRWNDTTIYDGVGQYEINQNKDFFNDIISRLEVRARYEEDSAKEEFSRWVTSLQDLYNSVHWDKKIGTKTDTQVWTTETLLDDNEEIIHNLSAYNHRRLVDIFNYWTATFERGLTLVESAATMRWGEEAGVRDPKVALGGMDEELIFLTDHLTPEEENQHDALRALGLQLFKKHHEKSTELEKIKGELLEEKNNNNSKRFEELEVLFNDLKQEVEDLKEKENEADAQLVVFMKEKGIDLEEGFAHTYITYNKDSTYLSYSPSDNYSEKSPTSEIPSSFKNFKYASRSKVHFDPSVIKRVKEEKFATEKPNDEGRVPHDEWLMPTKPANIDAIHVHGKPKKFILEFAERFGVDVVIHDQYNGKEIERKVFKEKYYFQKGRSGVKGFYDVNTNEAFLNEKLADATTTVHEAFTHPFINQVQRENPELYSNLLGEASKNKQVRDFINTNYGEETKQVQDHEMIAYAIDLHVSNQLNEIKDRGLIQVIRDFFANMSRALREIFNNPSINASDFSPELTLKEIAQYATMSKTNVLNLNQQRDDAVRAGLETTKKYFKELTESYRGEVYQDNKENVEKLLIYKTLFNHPETSPSTTQVQPTAYFSGDYKYLSTDFLADFKSRILKEKQGNTQAYQDVFKHFEITAKGIELKTNDAFTKGRIKLLMPNDKLGNNFQQYTMVSRSPSLQGIFTLPQSKSQKDQVIHLANHPEQLPNHNRFVNEYGDLVVVDNLTDPVAKINGKIYQKVSDKGTSSVYFSLPLRGDQGHRDLSPLPVPTQSEVQRVTNTIHTNGPDAYVEVQSTLSNREKRKVNDKMDECG